MYCVYNETIIIQPITTHDVACAGQSRGKLVRSDTSKVWHLTMVKSIPQSDKAVLFRTSLFEKTLFHLATTALYCHCSCQTKSSKALFLGHI